MILKAVAFDVIAVDDALHSDILTVVGVTTIAFQYRSGPATVAGSLCGVASTTVVEPRLELKNPAVTDAQLPALSAVEASVGLVVARN